MLMSMAQSNPGLFQMISDKMGMSRQLDKLSKLKDLMETNQEELKAKQAKEWTHWITRYRYGGEDCEGQRQYIYSWCVMQQQSGRSERETFWVDGDVWKRDRWWGRQRAEEMRCWFWRCSFPVVTVVALWRLISALSLPQEASGSGAGGSNGHPGRAGGKEEGDGQHQPTRRTQELHRPECDWGRWEWRLLWGQRLSPVAVLASACSLSGVLTGFPFLFVRQVQRLLKVLEKPFSSQPGLELPAWVGQGGADEVVQRDEGEEEQQAAKSSTAAKNPVPYDSKPPTWAHKICVSWSS